jgi:hypothetical protein
MKCSWCFSQATNEEKKKVIWGARFLSTTVDEVTTIDNGTWVSVTLHYVTDWGRENFLAKLDHVEDGPTSNILTKVITKAICNITGMSRIDIVSRMLAFGAGELSQLFFSPFLSSVHQHEQLELVQKCMQRTPIKFH